MTYEQKDLTFTLFKNDRKQQDNHPDMSGTAKIGGLEYYVNAWQKTDRNGNAYFSGSLKIKQAPPALPPAEPSEDDIAF